jgi:hypothetical protein
MTYCYGYEDEDLYVEQGTERVPDDGQFHIVLRGKVIEREATLKRALGRLQQLRSNLPSDEDIASGANVRSKMMQAEMAKRHLQQSTAEKTAQYGRKGRKG